MKQHVQLGIILILEALGAILVLVVLSRLTALILLVLIAIVLTTGIDPLVRGLQRAFARWFRLPRVLATIIVLLVAVSLLLGAVAVLVITAVREAINVSASHPNLREHILNWTDHLAQRYPLLPNANAVLHWVSRQSSNVGQYLWSTTQAVFGFIGGLFSVFMVLVLTIFFSTFRDGIFYNLLQLVPPAHQPRVREVARLAAAKMGGWLRGQVIMALIITTAIWPVMLALGLPY